MNLLNEQVTHKNFGQGNIIACDDEYIEVSFPSGNRKFVYPDVFGTFLFLKDSELGKRVEEVKQRVEKERKKEEAKLEKIRIAEEAERQKILEREKLLQNHKLSPVSQAAFWLDEAEQQEVFTDWKVFTGLRKSGANEGRPNRLVRLHQNSSCLITQRDAGEPEENRRIVGLFMVGEFFVGKLCEDGYIPAHSKYRIRLSEEESQKLLFWNYYVNERYPANMTWNSGRHRYFDNVWAAQVLRDIIALKEDPEELKLLKDFLKHFCEMNRLKQGSLPEPNGALIRANIA